MPNRIKRKKKMNTNKPCLPTPMVKLLFENIPKHKKQKAKNKKKLL